jgi:hypothetical protein
MFTGPHAALFAALTVGGLVGFSIAGLIYLLWIGRRID